MVAYKYLRVALADVQLSEPENRNWQINMNKGAISQVIYILLLFFSCNAVSVLADLPDVKYGNKSVRMSKGKHCNVNICFAIDGSGSIGVSEFAGQKDLILDVAAVLSSVDDVKFRFVAVQYNFGLSPISSLTADVQSFQSAVYSEPFDGGVTSFIASGLAYCEAELMKRPEEVGVIVLLSDFRDNSPEGNLVSRASNFRQFFDSRGRLYTVEVGFSDSSKSQSVARAGGGNAYKVGVENIDLAIGIEDFAIGCCRP